MLIILFCSWGCEIFQNIVKTPFRRFITFSIINTLSLASFFISVAFIIYCYLPRHTIGCEKVCNITITNQNVNDLCGYFECSYVKYTHLDIFKAYIAVLAFEATSFILLIVAYILMFTHSSDKEIRENACRNHYIIDYFRSPQVYFFIISIVGLITGTLVQYIVSSYMIPTCMKSLDKQAINTKRIEEYDAFGYRNGITFICNQTNILCDDYHHFYFDNSCSWDDAISECNSSFYDFNQCDYLYENIYNCTWDSINYHCSPIGKCNDIEQFKNINNCSSFDDCPDSLYNFYYYGYCEYKSGYVYNCTNNDRYNLYDCNEIGNYSSQFQYENINNCSRWDKCDSFQSNFYYYRLCGNYQYNVYNCSMESQYYDFACQFSSQLFKVISGFGLIQLFIFVVFLIVSTTCLKGTFFRKILEIPSLRYFIHIFPFLFYPCVIILEIIVIKNFRLNFIENTRPRYIWQPVLTILFCIIQCISLIFLLLGLSFVKLNKSDIDIIENSELNQPLFENA